MLSPGRLWRPQGAGRKRAAQPPAGARSILNRSLAFTCLRSIHTQVARVGSVPPAGSGLITAGVEERQIGQAVRKREIGEVTWASQHLRLPYSLLRERAGSMGLTSKSESAAGSERSGAAATQESDIGTPRTVATGPLLRVVRRIQSPSSVIPTNGTKVQWLHQEFRRVGGNRCPSLRSNGRTEETASLTPARCDREQRTVGYPPARVCGPFRTDATFGKPKLERMKE